MVEFIPAKKSSTRGWTVEKTSSWVEYSGRTWWKYKLKLFITLTEHVVGDICKGSLGVGWVYKGEETQISIVRMCTLSWLMPRVVPRTSANDRDPLTWGGRNRTATRTAMAVFGDDDLKLLSWFGTNWLIGLILLGLRKGTPQHVIQLILINWSYVAARVVGLLVS